MVPQQTDKGRDRSSPPFRHRKAVVQALIARRGIEPSEPSVQEAEYVTCGAGNAHISFLRKLPRPIFIETVVMSQAPHTVANPFRGIVVDSD